MKTTSTLIFLLSTEHVFCDGSIGKSSILSSVHGNIPVINIEAWTKKNCTSLERFEIANAVDKACSEIGFFVVKGHSIPQGTINKLWKVSAEFFDLSMDEKLAVKSNNTSTYPYGYEHSERLQWGMDGKNKDDQPDLKETFSLGPSDPKSGMPSRQFPSKPMEFQKSMEHYYTEMENLSLALLSIFAVALDLPEDWFVEKMNHHMSALRILNYFPLNLDSVSPGSIRASPHTDYGALTILRSGGPGLQVLLKKDGIQSDVWIDVPDLRDVFVINIGDMMQRWTNDRWVSTVHRVVVPTADTSALTQRRLSIAYFCNVNGDTIVRPISTCVEPGQHMDVYDAVIARDYLMAKHLASMATVVDHGSVMKSANDEL